MAALAILALLAGAAGVPGSLVGCPRTMALAGEAEDEKPKKSVDAASVFFGDPAKWEKPAEVDPDAVYAKIDEYKQITDEGLQPGDPKYEILMTKASRKFRHAIRKTAKDGGYDLIAKTGSVKGAGTVPVITQDVIGNL